MAAAKSWKWEVMVCPRSREDVSLKRYIQESAMKCWYPRNMTRTVWAAPASVKPAELRQQQQLLAGGCYGCSCDDNAPSAPNWLFPGYCDAGPGPLLPLLPESGHASTCRNRDDYSNKTMDMTKPRPNLGATKPWEGFPLGRFSIHHTPSANKKTPLANKKTPSANKKTP